MARRGEPAPVARPAGLDVEARAAELARADPVAGVAGPGRWLVAEFVPTALFALKPSYATSSVGKTLVVPTPYAVKMALVDAAFRAGLPDAECARLLRSLVRVSVRLAPPEQAMVTHTFLKIRQENRDAASPHPFIASVAYREFVHYRGGWRWAFDLAGGDDDLAERLVGLVPHINYVGKRGSFVQFVGVQRAIDLGEEFTQPLDGQSGPPNLFGPAHWHVAPLDDFGPEADLEVLSSYRPTKAHRDRHRRFVPTLVPLGMVNTGPGFSEYRRA